MTRGWSCGCTPRDAQAQAGCNQAGSGVAPSPQLLGSSRGAQQQWPIQTWCPGPSRARAPGRSVVQLVMLLVPRIREEGVMPLPGPSRAKPGLGSGRGPTHASAAAAILLERCRYRTVWRDAAPRVPSPVLAGTPWVWLQLPRAHFYGAPLLVPIAQRQREGCNTSSCRAKPG